MFQAVLGTINTYRPVLLLHVSQNTPEAKKQSVMSSTCSVGRSKHVYFRAENRSGRSQRWSRNVLGHGEETSHSREDTKHHEDLSVYTREKETPGDLKHL